MTIMLEQRRIGTMPLARQDGTAPRHIVRGRLPYYNGTPETEAVIGHNRVQRIAIGAFDNSLTGDVLAVFDGNTNLVLGRTVSRSLTLSANLRGIDFEITLPATETVRQRVAVPMERGEVTGANFGFEPAEGGVRYLRETRADGVVDVFEIIAARLLWVGPAALPRYAAATAELHTVQQRDIDRACVAARADAVARLEEAGRVAARVRAIHEEERWLGSLRVYGLAGLYYRPTRPQTQFEIKPGVYQRFLPGCFAESIQSGNVRCYLNHDPNCELARQGDGRLRLQETLAGVRFDARLLWTPALESRLIEPMNRGALRGASVWFDPETVRLHQTREMIDGRPVDVLNITKADLLEIGPVADPFQPGAWSMLNLPV